MIIEDRLVEVKSTSRQNGMDYDITSKSNPFDGYVIVSLGPLWAINEPELHKIAHSHSIRTNVLAAEITHFFPNGNPRTEEQILSYMRKGVGTLVLDMVLNDASKSGAELIYCQTPRDSMSSFLKKNSFNQFNGSEPWASYFYKRI